MNTDIPSHLRFALPILAAISLIAGIPTGAGAYDDTLVKNVTVKDRKVKVKVAGGKAKIKHKGNGKKKVKVKGSNGDIAHAIAREAAGCEPGRRAKPVHPGYYK